MSNVVYSETSYAEGQRFTVALTGINVGSLNEGPVTISAISTDTAGNQSTARTRLGACRVAQSGAARRGCL